MTNPYTESDLMEKAPSTSTKNTTKSTTSSAPTDSLANNCEECPFCNHGLTIPSYGIVECDGCGFWFDLELKEVRT